MNLYKKLEKLVSSNIYKKQWLVVLCILLFALGFYIRKALSGVSPSYLDFGFEANTASRILDGQVPYRDFLTLINPLHFYMTAISMALFGTTTQTLFTFACIIGSLTNVIVMLIIYKLSNSFLYSIAAWVTSLVVSQNMLSSSPNYSFTATVFYILAVYLFIQILEHLNAKTAISKINCFILGFISCLVFLSKQTVGVYFILSFLISTILFARKHLSVGKILSILIGFAIPIVVFFMFLIKEGAMKYWVKDIIKMLFTFTHEAKINPPFLFTGTQELWIKCIYNFSLLYMLVLAVMFYNKIHTEAANRRNLSGFVITLIFSFGLFLITLERFSALKLVVGLQLLAPFSIAVIYITRNKFLKFTSIIYISSIMIIGIGQISNVARRKQSLSRFDSDKGYFYAQEDQRNTTELVVNYLKKISSLNKNIVVIPAAPIYYFLSDIKNPTRYDLAIPGNLTKEDKSELADYLKYRADGVVFQEFYFDGVKSEAYISDIYNILRDDYCVSERLGSAYYLTPKNRNQTSECVSFGL